MTETPKASIASAVNLLRRNFESGVTRPESWRREQLKQLRELLVSRGDEFERALHSDLGKSATEAQLSEIGFLVGEIDHTLARLAKWMRPRKVSLPLAVMPASAKIVPEPLGVVLVIAPWNYPLMLALSPLIGAISAGNAVVVKPSECAPATSALLAQTLAETLDPRAVTVVEGGVPETTELLRERFDHIFYTGNGRVGRIVARAAAEHLTPVTLELGGKSPAYIDATVEPAEAARRIVWGKLMNAGQTCVAPDYVMATPEVLATLQPALIEAIRELYGTAIARNSDYGRIVNDAQFARLQGLLGDGEVVFGGDHDAASRYFGPTLMRVTDREAPVMQQEIFGPILPLVEVTGIDDALRLVNSREKPLAAYVFSAQPTVRQRWERETSSGALAYGVPVLHLIAPELPFGGVGESGMGAYHGRRSFDTFSHEKSVFSKPFAPDTLAATVMPPYTAGKAVLVRRVLQRLR